MCRWNCAWTVANDAPALANVAIKSHVHTFTLAINSNESLYAGQPSMELDKAWHELLKPINIRVSTEELKKINQTSLKLPDGSGYLAQLGAFHELHCVVSVTVFRGIRSISY